MLDARDHLLGVAVELGEVVFGEGAGVRLGPAVVQGAYADTAVYLIGPVAGGLAAALVWSFVLLERRTN